MSSIHSISPEKLARRIGVPHCPALIDVRGADTARFDLAPEAARFSAASLGLSRMYPDELEQLEAGMMLYDAFYRRRRDETDEPHNWPTTKSGKTP